MTVEITCPNCGFSRRVPRERIPAGVRWATCPSCKQRFEFALPEAGPDFRQEQGETGPAQRAGRTLSHWENRSELGLWGGIYRTFKDVLFSPERFFSTITFHAGLKEPLAYGILLGSIGTMFGFFWQFLILSGGILSLNLGPLTQFTATVIFLGIIIVSPLYVLIKIFFTSGLLHLLLLMARGGKNGFEATFRVTSYAQAAEVLGLIPFIGGVAGSLWHMVVLIVGLREIHETTYLRVFIAILIPFALILVLVVVVLIPLFLLI